MSKTQKNALVALVIPLSLLLLSMIGTWMIQSDTAQSSAFYIPPPIASDVAVLPIENDSHRLVTLDIPSLTVKILNGDTGVEEHSLTLPLGTSDPIKVLSDVTTQVAYVVCEEGEIFVINATTGTSIQPFLNTNRRLTSCAVDSNGVVYGIDPTNQKLIAYDTKDSTKSNRSIPSTSACVGVMDSGDVVAVAISKPSNRTGIVSFFDPADLTTLLGSVNIEDGASTLDFANFRAYVALNPSVGFSRIAILDITTYTESSSIAAEWGQIALSAGYENILVYSGNSDTVALYDTSIDADLPTLVGTKSCFTGQLSGYGSLTNPPLSGGNDGSGGKKGPAT